MFVPVITLSIARIIDYSFSTTGNFPHRWKPLKLPLCSKRVMQATHPIIVQFLSLQSYLGLLNVTSTILCMTFLKWTTWFTTSSPGLFPRRNERLLDVFRQSGFRKHQGSETALFKNESWWALTKLDNNRVSGVLLVDYCKAFDIVDHNLLLLKLAYGFTNRACNWCHSYLSGRRQLVCIDSKESSLACVDHGVPQGSILGPLFFILFIKDWPVYITEGRGSINPPPPPLPYPLYDGGDMTLRVRPRVQPYVCVDLPAYWSQPLKYNHAHDKVALLLSGLKDSLLLA